MVKKDQKEKVETTLAKGFDSDIIQTTQVVLDKMNIPRYYYGFDNLFDDSYCVNKIDNKWELSYYERGQNDIIYRDDSLEEVCKILIEKLVSSDEEKKLALSLFLSQINSIKRLQTPRIYKPKPAAVASKMPLYVGDYSKWGETVRAVSDISGLSYQQSLSAIQALTGIVGKELKKGGKVQLVGFGTFEVRKIAAATGRNPQAGSGMKIKASKAPKFTPEKKLEDLVNYGGKETVKKYSKELVKY